MSNGISFEQFCLRNKVSYNIFNKWYRDTRKQIVEVQIDGKPSHEEQTPTQPHEEEKTLEERSPVHILVEIRMTNGFFICYIAKTI